MITLPPGYKPRRGHIWIFAVMIAVLLAGHAVILYFASSHLPFSGGLALGLIFFVLVKHLGFLGPAHSLLRRLTRKR